MKKNTLSIFVVAMLSLFSLSMRAAEVSTGHPKYDQFLLQQWETMIQEQHFPLVPHSTKLPDDSSSGQAERQRYIMHLATSEISTRVINEKDYTLRGYQTKEGGDFILLINTKYKKCFEKITKKFDQMQWVVFHGGLMDGTPVLILEYPRQCDGTVERSGGKLSKKK